MREFTALIADVVTIVGVLALLAFLLNHPVTRRFGVWAGALRDPYGYGWKRRQRGWRRRWRAVVDRLLSPLSRIGSETRQPMKPDTGPTIPRDQFEQSVEMRLGRMKQAAKRDQDRMEEAGARIARRRWRREHRRSLCEFCKTPSSVTLLLCMEDCSWNERYPRHLRHRCTDCVNARGLR